jgi:hypothetical protein
MGTGSHLFVPTSSRPMFTSSIPLILRTIDAATNFELFKSHLLSCPVLLSLAREFGDAQVSLSILYHFHTCYPLSQISDYFGHPSIPFLASELPGLSPSELDNIPVSAFSEYLHYWYLP